MHRFATLWFMKILAFETSCDETAVAVVNAATREILADKIYSQTTEHLQYGGVVPEIASRAHLERLQPLTQTALNKAGLALEDIDAIAATIGPGLTGALLMGATFAKMLALTAKKPFLGVNHLEGHALSPLLTEPDLTFPYLLLQMSGGHCQFELIKGVGSYKTLGATLDDAVGECFDKSAKLLGLPYPGGPEIEKLATKGDDRAVAFPVAKKNSGLDFSFSGLKTSVRNYIQKQPNLTKRAQADIAASFQYTIAKTLSKKTSLAFDVTNVSHFVIAGGVAANKTIRTALQTMCAERNVRFFAPPLKYCTDNAVMIAWTAGLRLLNGDTPHTLNARVRPRWPLNEMTLGAKSV